MEQIAMVKSVLDNGMAQVAVQRETACGAAHSCADCAGCEKMMTRTENVVVAYNDVNAHPGDVVKVQSENGNFFKTAAIVYLLPLVLALVFYGVASALSLGGEGLHALCAGIGFVLGILVAVAWDRHMKKVSGLRFHIVERDARIDQAPWGGYIRHNQLWREVYDLSDTLLEEQYLCTNDAIMMYSPLLSAAPADGE